MSCFNRAFTEKPSVDWMPAGKLPFHPGREYGGFRAILGKMPEISSVKNALQTVVKKDRLLNAVFVGSKSFVVAIGRTAYAFWLQATGLIFVLFTVIGASDLVKHYHRHTLDQKRMLLVGTLTVVCGYFTVHSFIKARRTLAKKK
jgi:hypothetical protein